MMRKRTLTFAVAITAFYCLWATATLSAAEEDRPIQVFILAGQSNMEGKAHVDVLEYQAFKGDDQERYKKFTSGPGQWKVRDDVWIKFFDRHGRLTVGYGSPDRIGPELDFGFTIGDYLDEPVLLIKTAWGGKTLGCDFRPPSSGLPDEAFLKAELERRRSRDPNLTLDDIKARYGYYYREMVKEVRATMQNLDTLFPELKGRDYQFAGFVWFQGWNEQYNDTITTSVARRSSATWATRLPKA